jgi:hypothetical protein
LLELQLLAPINQKLLAVHFLWVQITTVLLSFNFLSTLAPLQSPSHLSPHTHTHPESMHHEQQEQQHTRHSLVLRELDPSPFSSLLVCGAISRVSYKNTLSSLPSFRPAQCPRVSSYSAAAAPEVARQHLLVRIYWNGKPFKSPALLMSIAELTERKG